MVPPRGPPTRLRMPHASLRFQAAEHPRLVSSWRRLFPRPTPAHGPAFCWSPVFPLRSGSPSLLSFLTSQNSCVGSSSPPLAWLRSLLLTYWFTLFYLPYYFIYWFTVFTRFLLRYFIYWFTVCTRFLLRFRSAVVGKGKLGEQLSWNLCVVLALSCLAQ